MSHDKIEYKLWFAPDDETIIIDCTKCSGFIVCYEGESVTEWIKAHSKYHS